MQNIVVIPTYNERGNIRPLIEELLALPLPLGVIVVDDNSPDGTGELVAQLAAEDERVHLISRPAKLGLGTAHLTGFRRALAMGARHILSMDADFSHNPRFIPEMVASSTTADVVIGSRYVAGGGAANSPFRRRLLSRGANLFARTMLRLPAHDCTAGFRCYQRRVLEHIDLDRIRSDGYSFLIEMLFLCHQAGFTVTEVPITFVDREHGISKISKAEIGKALLTVVRLAVVRLQESRLLGQHMPTMR
ncbi:MAG TPA: polyprenol monophosphomannose synthase [Anaerolineae bacterium]|nr:polyprenol monophosphomannose synthase [Anaerolineae bacterium]